MSRATRATAPEARPPIAAVEILGSNAVEEGCEIVEDSEGRTDAFPDMMGGKVN
jgi:hypothetical protein